VTKITKRETIEGELGRFMLHQGEEPQAMYNRLKTLVNQVRNLGSTKWDDHEMVKVILRSLVFLNPTQVQLIRGDPRYKLISPEEVIGKFVSFELMIKGSKKIIEQGTSSSVPEAQPVAFKATEEKKEDSTPSRIPIDASKLDNEEMALIIKSFRQILKQWERITSPVPRRFATSVVSPIILLQNVHYLVIVTGATTRRERGDKRRSTTRRRVAMTMFAGSGTPTRAPPTPPTRTPPTSPSTKGSSSPNVGHKCLMAKDGKKKKVKSKSSTKYATSSDEDNSSDEEDNLLTLFANLNMQQKEKLNELISAIHEKDDLLDSQEDFLIKENKRHVKTKNAYAQEVEKMRN
jgi:hypothetical protein